MSIVAIIIYRVLLNDHQSKSWVKASVGRKKSFATRNASQQRFYEPEPCMESRFVFGHNLHHAYVTCCRQSIVPSRFGVRLTVCTVFHHQECLHACVRGSKVNEMKRKSDDEKAEGGHVRVKKKRGQSSTALVVSQGNNATRHGTTVMRLIPFSKHFFFGFKNPDFCQ